MSAFTDSELEYLSAAVGRRLARIATVGKDGTPHVVPVGFRYQPAHDSIEVRGHDLVRSKKYRDVERTGRASIVVDDLESVDPWRPRGIEVRGRAEAIPSPRPVIRIHPERIVSWGIDARGRLARSVETGAIAAAAGAE
jgi:pyridoxamine 5'-phosphate oxidase family protein